MLAVLYSIFAVAAGVVFDAAVRDAARVARIGAPIASFVSRTASATAAAGVISDTSYGAAHVASRARIPVSTKALAFFGVLASAASMIAASRSMPTTCAELEVTCVLMDNQQHIFKVPQTWSLVGGCAARHKDASLSRRRRSATTRPSLRDNETVSLRAALSDRRASRAATVAVIGRNPVPLVPGRRLGLGSPPAARRVASAQAIATSRSAASRCERFGHSASPNRLIAAQSASAAAATSAPRSIG